MLGQEEDQGLLHGGQEIGPQGPISESSKPPSANSLRVRPADPPNLFLRCRRCRIWEALSIQEAEGQVMTTAISGTNSDQVFPALSQQTMHQQ
jgi:hypothetical protein